ncbi:MAG: GH3 auxin-responsive promoter family protein, partial [Methanobrevibacter sp.]|nr:GH3 auxin-responsive promoter family protein [Methanobrevibacter sp.]
MELLEKISSMDSKELIPFWLELCQNCYDVQEKTLFDILNYSKDTEIGQKFDFESISSIKEYQEKVPILEYDDISDYIERMAEGEENILFPGRTSFFISTSGTTGNSKKIPENEKSKKAKSIVLNLRRLYLTKVLLEKIKNSDILLNRFKEKDVDLYNPESFDGFHFYSVTSASPNKKTKGGIEIGFASGKTFDNSALAQKTVSYPIEIMGLSDGEASMYLSMLFALRYDDIFIILANNAGRVYSRFKYAQEHAEEIINDLKNGTITKRINITEDERKLFEGYLEPHVERAGFLESLLNKGKEFFIPKYYWPYLILAMFWLGGSVGVNVDKLKPY